MLKHEKLFRIIYNTFNADEIYLDGYLSEQIYYQLEDNLSENYLKIKKYVLKEYSKFLKKTVNNDNVYLLENENMKYKINNENIDEINTYENSNIENEDIDESSTCEDSNIENEDIDENSTCEDSNIKNEDIDENSTCEDNNIENENIDESNTCEDNNIEKECIDSNKDSDDINEYYISETTEYSMNNSDSSLDELLTLSAVETLKFLDSKIDKSPKNN